MISVFCLVPPPPYRQVLLLHVQQPLFRQCSSSINGYLCYLCLVPPRVGICIIPCRRGKSMWGCPRPHQFNTGHSRASNHIRTGLVLSAWGYHAIMWTGMEGGGGHVEALPVPRPSHLPPVDRHLVRDPQPMRTLATSCVTTFRPYQRSVRRFLGCCCSVP
jgi:hypothetical protein